MAVGCSCYWNHADDEVQTMGFFGGVLILVKICRLIVLTSTLAGILFTLVIFSMAYRFGVASAFALCALLPYIVLLCLNKNSNPPMLTGILSVLALTFVCAGNYAYFKSAMLNPSGSSGDSFSSFQYMN